MRTKKQDEIDRRKLLRREGDLLLPHRSDLSQRFDRLTR